MSRATAGPGTADEPGTATAPTRDVRRRRATPPAVRLLRAWFTLASRIAPRVAERQAARLFLMPRRRAARTPEIPGMAARLLAVDVEGRTLAGWSWGAGPTVLLVHGWSGRAADMTVFAEAVVRAGFRAVAFDMPAHGHSPGRHTSLAEWRRVLPEIARVVARGDPPDGSAAVAAGGVPVTAPLHAVVAHSFGGTATVLALASGLTTRGVVLLAPALGPRAFLDRIRRYIGLPDARAAGMERELVRLVGQDLRHFDAAAAAAGLDAPAHLLHDPDDPEVPWAHTVAIAKAWRGSQHHPAPGVGHYGMLTAPDVARRVAGLVVGFGVERPD